MKTLFNERPECRIVAFRVKRSAAPKSFLLLQNSCGSWVAPVQLCEGMHQADVSASLIYLN